jgi:hypothetical protein
VYPGGAVVNILPPEDREFARFLNDAVHNKPVTPYEAVRQLRRSTPVLAAQQRPALCG